MPRRPSTRLRAVPGVAASGPFGEGTFSVRAANKLRDAALIGYEPGKPGAPTTLTQGRLPTAPFEVVASSRNRNEGFGIGDHVQLEKGGRTLTVVGLASDINYSVLPTMFTTFDTYATARRDANPGATAVWPSAVAVDVAPGSSARAVRDEINARIQGVEALTRDQAVRESPGVASVGQSLGAVVFLCFFVVAIVAGLFFLILTVQKASALTLLRAIGIRAGVLARSLVVQVVIVVAGGIVIGGLLTTARAGREQCQPRSNPDIATARADGRDRVRARDRRVVERDPPRAAHRADPRHHPGRHGVILALRELRRTPRRFVTATVVLTLLVVLLLFLGGLLDGLYLGSTGALRAQRADVIVYSADANDSIIRSRIDPALRAHVEQVPGVTDVNGLGITLVGTTVPGRSTLADTAVIGYERAPRGVPAPPPAGEAWADRRLAAFGVHVGQTLGVGPEQVPIRVRGLGERHELPPPGRALGRSGNVAPCTGHEPARRQCPARHVRGPRRFGPTAGAQAGSRHRRRNERQDQDAHQEPGRVVVARAHANRSRRSPESSA